MGARTLVLLTFVLALASACSDRTESEIQETLDLNSLPLSTPTLPESISEEPEAASAGCVNDARFVEDLTIPDGHQVRAGEVLDKRWAVLNSGTCDWSAGYRLVRIDEGAIDAPEELALYPARADETGVWSVQITAPDQKGDQMASWQAQAPDGSFFGDPVFVLIEVISNP